MQTLKIYIQCNFYTFHFNLYCLHLIIAPSTVEKCKFKQEELGSFRKAALHCRSLILFVLAAFDTSSDNFLSFEYLLYFYQL